MPTSSAKRACRGRLYLVKHYPGLVLSDDPADIVPANCSACARARRCCTSSTCTRPAATFSAADRISAADAFRDPRRRQRQRAWTYIYNWPVTKLPRIESGRFLAAIATPTASAARRSRARQTPLLVARSMPPAPRTAVACSGAIFEPGDEIEGLAEIAAVIELPRHLRQIFQAAGDMLRFRPRRSSRRSSWFSAHHAADFWIGISAAQLASLRPSGACSAASCSFSAVST